MTFMKGGLIVASIKVRYLALSAKRASFSKLATGKGSNSNKVVAIKLQNPEMRKLHLVWSVIKQTGL